MLKLAYPVLISQYFYFSLTLHQPGRSLKKFFSIAFIAILLLNVMGYYVVFLGMQYRNDITMSRMLDSDRYNDSEKITLKLPVSLAYMPDQSNFQRVEGKFEHRGEFYRLVKQKYAKDTLTVICVRDHENERINKALSSYVKTFVDSGSDSDESLKITVSFIKDFLAHKFSILTVTPGWQSDITASIFVDNLTAPYTSLIVPPPKAL